MKNKHVLFHIINSLSTGGAERMVVNLLRYHNRERYEPVCICLRTPVDSPYEAMVREMGVPLYFLQASEVKLSWLHNFKLNALFKQYRPTIVHTHLEGIRYAYPLMFKYRTPVRVHTFHTLAEHELGAHPCVSCKWVRVLAFRYRLGGVIPVAIAREVQRSIQQLYHYPNPPLIPNGIPTHHYAPNPTRRARFRTHHALEPHALVLTHIGRFAPVKNHALLLRAFAQLHSPQPLYLLLVGDGELRPAMEQLAQQLGIAQRVRFLGIQADVAPILNGSDIFVLPSDWEGNPMALQEAMAAGLAVVATAVGGVPELVESGVSGLLVGAGDEGGLVAALQGLVEDAGLRARLGAAARARAEALFDIRRTVALYEQLYEERLSAHKCPS